MSNFQTPYSKIAWLEARLKALESKVSKWITPNGIVGGGTSGATTAGVVETHTHSGSGEGGVISGGMRFAEGAAPSTPPAGHVVLYAKTDGRMYSKDDAGVESGPL